MPLLGGILFFASVIGAMAVSVVPDWFLQSFGLGVRMIALMFATLITGAVLMEFVYVALKTDVE
ncbi:hypothetical protein [Neomesorhizobium albiziae]|uniref:hypothetical protein n=1 Tax=Neomesorhizobium albiziae TaxID=335020 RepID=UPI00122C3A95|nr:hypothetical protein [Mesorhizobium albiziae]